METFTPETRLRSVDHDPFAGPAIVCTVPSTEPQREVFIASRMGREASCAYNESVSLLLTGPLDRALMERTLDLVVHRHEGLRSVMSDNALRMIVLERVDIALWYTDISDRLRDDRERELAAIGDQDMTTAFDLINGPLFRTYLIRTGPEEHLLRLTGHHVVVDGWSLGIVMGDISRIYSALVKGQVPDLPPAVPFSTYAMAMIDLAHTPEQRAVLEHWRAQYKGPLPQVDLPTDRPRPKQKTYNGARVDLDLEPAAIRGLKEVATRSGSSFVTTLLTAFELLVYQLTGDPDVVVGLPAAGQSDMGMKDLVGHCVNLLPLHSRIADERPFLDHLKERRGAVLDAYENQRITFGTLVRELKVPREPGRIPLAPVVFNIDMNMDDGVRFDGLRHRFISNPRRYENFELFLNATGSTASDHGSVPHLTLEWSYNTDLFDAATVRGWHADLSRIIAQIIARPSDSVASILGQDAAISATLPPPAWAGEAVPYPREKSVSRLFDDTVEAYPEKTALIHGSLRMTYADLHQRVLHLAHVLANTGVRPGHLVGLCCERDPSMVIAQLAIMRCGGTFVPIDHTYPEERLRFLIDDTGIQVLLAPPSIAAALPAHSARVVPLDRTTTAPATTPFPPQDGPELPAYIMYTSGSTGRPKGVVIPHRGIVRLVRNQNYVQFGPDLVITQLSNVSFDASTFELWGALLNGGTLVMQEQAKPTLAEITATIEKHGVNTMFITTALFNLLVDEQLPKLKGLRTILTGGEVMSLTHIRKALAMLGPGVIHNIYGPTENTTFSCQHPVNSEEDIGRAVPIGHALNNTFLYVLDVQRRPVPIGVTGELYTGGEGVALGYWKRPDLTVERFLPDPFLGGTHRMYRTGDLVRWLPGGALEFMGRADDQVKVRGFRIEPGEIENAISELRGVRDRIVVARKDLPSDKQLVAYVVPSDFDPEKDLDANDRFMLALKDHLARRLPEYMRPSYTVLMRELPLNQNGKVDKKVLPLPQARPARMQASHVAPRDETERRLAAIWSKALGMTDIGLHDDFFELGGHSLMGLQLLTQVEQQFGVALPLKELFVMPTIARMADALRTKVDPALWTNLQAIQPEGSLPPMICVQGDEGNYFLPKYMGKEQPFYGIFHQGEDGHPMHWTTVEEMAAHYIQELRSARPHGPYFLSGYSFGGMIAYEMAQQLKASGEEVPVLVIFDMYDPVEYRKVSHNEVPWYAYVKENLVKRISRSYFDRGQPLPTKLRHNYIIGVYDVAIRSYEPKPYDGPITLMRTRPSPGPPDMGWSTWAKGGLEIRMVPGNHYNMIKEPHVRALAAQLNDVVRKSLQRMKAAAMRG